MPARGLLARLGSFLSRMATTRGCWARAARGRGRGRDGRFRGCDGGLDGEGHGRDACLGHGNTHFAPGRPKKSLREFAPAPTAPGGDVWIYTYDQRNELIKAEHKPSASGAVDLSAVYKYDTLGNRIEKDVDNDGAGPGAAVVTKFVYDGWKASAGHLTGNENWDVWADLSASGSLTTRYVRGGAIDELFARITNGTAYWDLTDRQGSIRTLTDKTGTVLDAINYDGFGNVKSESVPTAPDGSRYLGRYGWTGREVDAETGLQYNRARYQG